MVAPKHCSSTPTAAAAAAAAPAAASAMDCAPRDSQRPAEAPLTRRASARAVAAVSEFPQPGSPMAGTKRGRAAALAAENLLSHSAEDDDDDSDSDSGHDVRGMVGLEKMSMEERRRAIRRMKNRESARRVRARRIQQVGDLTTQVQAVAGENKDLKAGMALLRSQLHSIQAQLQEATTKCETLNNENVQLATELQALRGTAAGSNSNSGTKKGSVLGCGPSPPPVTSGPLPALAPIRTASPFTAGASSPLAQSPCGPSLRRNCSSLLHRQATIKAEQEAGNHLQPLGPTAGPAIALLADEPRGSLCTQDSTLTGDCKLWGSVQQPAAAGQGTVQGQQSINSSQLQLLLQGPGATLPCAAAPPSQQLLRPAQQDRCLFQGALQLGDTGATDAMLQAALGCDNFHLLQPFLPPLDSFWYEGLGSSLQILPSDLDFMLAPDFALQSASSKYAAGAGLHNASNAADSNVVGTVPPVDLAAPCTNTSASDDDSSEPHANQWSP